MLRTDSPTDRHTDQPHQGDTQITEFAARLIRRKAGQLVRRAGFSPSDREDIQQELVLVLLKGLRKFNPEVAHYNAFVTTVVERYVATILEHRKAAMRSFRRSGGSLNVTIEDGDGHRVELLATIVEGQQNRHTGGQPRSAEELHSLALDLQSVLECLPQRLRDICQRLGQDSTTDVARDLGIGRAALYEVIGRIRRRFEKAGLREYL